MPSLVQGLPAHQRIVSDITAAIGEDMLVRDSASEEVRRTRNRCRTIEGRLRSILKGVSGEVSEQVKTLRQLLLRENIMQETAQMTVAINEGGSPFAACAGQYVCH